MYLRSSCGAYFQLAVTRALSPLFLNHPHPLSPTEQPAGMIDLKVVKDITPYEKGGKEDFTRFNVDVDGDKMYKFKVNSQAEGQRWVEGLNEWRDYFLMNM
jgi:hypothetical protein